jgi:hypothetical protein
LPKEQRKKMFGCPPFHALPKVLLKCFLSHVLALVFACFIV